MNSTPNRYTRRLAVENSSISFLLNERRAMAFREELTDAEGEEAQESDGVRTQSPAQRARGLILIHREGRSKERPQCFLGASIVARSHMRVPILRGTVVATKAVGGGRIGASGYVRLHVGDMLIQTGSPVGRLSYICFHS